MALKVLMLRKKLGEKNKELSELRKTTDAFVTREAELEKAIEEAATEEETKAVDESIEELEQDKTENAEAITALETEIGEIETEIEALERSMTPAAAPAIEVKPIERGEHKPMNTRKFFGMAPEQRDAFFAREEVKNFIEEVRTLKTRGLTNGGLGVPEVMLEVLRNNMEQYSKLIKYVNVKSVGGKARQNIMGAVPEGVWMEAIGALNELDMALNQIEVDGFMVGGIIFVPNSLLEDSDIALGTEIMAQLGQAAGKGLDRGLLYGTGTKMPLGIAVRLAQTSAPSDWGTYAPAWTDLHTTHVLKLNIDGTTGATFYASLIAALGVAKPDYSDGSAFWVVNRKTHIKLMTKALAFDAAAALVAGVNNQMPIIGGDIIELEMVGDNEIIGGFGSAYLLAERAGAKIEMSEHARFKEMQTAFRGYARYDGMPVFGEAFVVVGFANADASVAATFPIDYANTDLGALGLVSAAGTASGDCIVTVTGAESSGTTLKYKLGSFDIVTGQTPVGFTALVSGTTQITAAAGKTITVVELDAAGKAIKAGIVLAVPKA
jgi:HK97 family phage major capsid protein